MVVARQGVAVWPVDRTSDLRSASQLPKHITRLRPARLAS